MMFCRGKKWWKSLALAGCAAVFISLPLSAAESLNQLAPKPVPPAGPSSTVPVSSLPPASRQNPGEVLIPKLRALIFVPTPRAASKKELGGQGVVFINVTVPSQPDFVQLVTPYLGKSLTRGQLNELIRSIILFYRGHDRPVVDVIVPQQEITHGVLQLVLLEGKVGKVLVTGNRWAPAWRITTNIRTTPGGPISQSGLQADLDWINQNPFVNAQLVYEPGEKVGQTNLNLQVQDRFPVRVYGGYEDSGNFETGFDRYFAGFNYGDLFGLGQQVNYQYTTSGNGENLRSHFGSYLIPLPWRHTLTFFGSYVETKGAIPPYVGLRGRIYQISGRYNIPLPTLSAPGALIYRHTFSLGFDYKYNDDSLAFGGLAVPAQPYDVDQFVVGYTGTETDPLGQTSIDDQFYISPGNWGGDNNNAAFASSHPDATSNYVYNTVILERLTRLPADWSLLLRGTLQTSNANLAPSEQLGFGGYDTVRGYDEREVSADEGYIFTTELHTPTVSLGDTFGLPDFRDGLQFLGFWDYGAAHDRTLLAGEPSETPLSAVGAGARYSINTYLSVRFDYAFQLLSTGFDNRHGSRSDIGLVLSY